MLAPFLDKRAEFPERAALVNQHAVDTVIFNSWKSGNRKLAWDGAGYDYHMHPQVAITILHDIVLDSFSVSDQQHDLITRYFTHMFYSNVITASGTMFG